mmetsp:Transcript_1866/g.2961  ORF Transcript_1866/g.2961 Transcript_1866/m.2961 type:complete len:235 (-) Transcript_1866:95-799(-)
MRTSPTLVPSAVCIDDVTPSSLTVSRTMSLTSGSASPARVTETRSFEPTGPRTLAAASSAVSVRTASESTSSTTSPARSPARSAGEPSTTELIRTEVAPPPSTGSAWSSTPMPATSPVATAKIALYIAGVRKRVYLSPSDASIDLISAYASSVPPVLTFLIMFCLVMNQSCPAKSRSTYSLSATFHASATSRCSLLNDAAALAESAGPPAGSAEGALVSRSNERPKCSAARGSA